MATRSSPAPDGLIRHRRQPFPSSVRGQWKLACCCGWSHEVSGATPRRQAEDELGRLFVEHVPLDERQAYLLVDRRPSGRLVDQQWNKEFEEYEGGTELPAGNFIMPEGRPCTLLEWWESDGIYYGRAQGFGLGDPVVELPLGEIRLENGRVFRAE